LTLPDYGGRPGPKIFMPFSNAISHQLTVTSIDIAAADDGDSPTGYFFYKRLRL